MDEAPRLVADQHSERHPEVFGELEHALEPVLADGDVSVAMMLSRAHGLRDVTRRLIVRFVEGFNGASVHRIGSRALLRQLRAPGGPYHRFLGGYAAFIERIRRSAGAIRLGAIVERIRWRRGQVRVLLASGERLFGRVGVVTVPLSILQSDGIRFEPALESKREALSRLVMGEARRVSLYTEIDLFRAPGILQTERAGFDVFWRSGPGMITAWAGGPRARVMSPRSLEALVTDAWIGVQMVLGRAMPEALVRAAFTHDWATDPYSLGAYSYVGVGGADAAADLATPLERTLYFAGEACSANAPGTVEGAWETGEAAARAIIRDHSRRDVHA